MVSNKEVVKWLKENRTDHEGNINLKALDFGDSNINFSDIKAFSINNQRQTAKNMILNDDQKSERKISNTWQQSKMIYNGTQIGKEYISNEEQKAPDIINFRQTALREIDNSNQLSDEVINNENQEAPKIYV